MKKVFLYISPAGGIPLPSLPVCDGTQAADQTGPGHWQPCRHPGVSDRTPCEAFLTGEICRSLRIPRPHEDHGAGHLHPGRGWKHHPSAPYGEETGPQHHADPGDLPADAGPAEAGGGFFGGIYRKGGGRMTRCRLRIGLALSLVLFALAVFVHKTWKE